MSAWSSPRLGTTALALAISLTVATPAAGQRIPSLGGVELRLGLVLPEAAEVGTGLFAEVDLGYLYSPSLRLVTGFSRFVADIDREAGGDEGSYVANGGWVGGRFDFLPLSRISPYVKTAFTFQSVDADAFDPAIGMLLDGVNVGVGAAVGAAYRIGGSRSLQATTELRRTFMNNVGNTSLEIGVRWQRRGSSAYYDQGRPITVRPAPGAAEPAQQTPVAAAPASPDQGPLPITGEPAAAPATPVTNAPVAPAVTSASPAAQAAAEAMLRQGVRRAGSSMRNVTGIEETSTDFIVILGGGAFASGSAEPTREARQELRLLATVLAGYPGHIVMVEGHTDSSGDAALNQRLATERAAVIRAGLIAEGVDPLWIAALGYGPDQPVATNDTAAGRARNRRVHIRISKMVCMEPPMTSAAGALVCSL